MKHGGRGGLCVWLAAGLAPLAAAADLDGAIDEVLPRIVELRHRIHANPELGNRERVTAALVAGHLRSLDLEVTTGIAHTGVLGVLRGALPGPVVAVRADMDALPVTEATDLPFRSTRRAQYGGQEVGVAHACGHDIHTAVQLGVASVLAGMRERLRGTVKFIFQPAEEGPPPGERGGATLMLEEGVLGDPLPEAIFALHAFPDLAVGRVAFTSGPALASSDRFRIEIRGRQTHGAWPHLGVDPIVLASQVVLALQTIPSRTLHPRADAVLTVGTFRGGERYNIIPEAVHLEGTVRTFDAGVQDTIERRVREILEGVTAAGGGAYTLDYERNNPSTYNDPALSALARASLERSLGAANVLDGEPMMVAEDFAWFARHVPGFYFWLGVVAPGTTSGGLHTPTFRADDSAITVGMRAMATLLIDFLSQGGRGRRASPRPQSGGDR